MKIESVTFRTSAATLAACPQTPLPEIAVSGRSNVGKSSLLNMLWKRRGLARVSGTPGKTQLLQFFLINENFHLVDLPGYGYARVPSAVQQDWRRMMSSYLQHREELAGVVQLLDCRHAPSQDDREMITWLLEVDLPFCLVLTKVDKLKRGQRAGAAAAILRSLAQDLELPGSLPVLETSAQSGEGQEALLAWMSSVLAGRA